MTSGIRSILAVVAGLVTIFATHIGTDEIMHRTGVFPPEGQPMQADELYVIAFAYRSVFSVLGCYITARLAPRAPMVHALVLGAIGAVLSTIAVIATWNMNLGPHWYPISLAATSLPWAYVGGLLARRKS